eukprot:15445099-Alexandrium_andersonii.AAC.1
MAPQEAMAAVRAAMDCDAAPAVSGELRTALITLMNAAQPELREPGNNGKRGRSEASVRRRRVARDVARSASRSPRR